MSFSTTYTGPASDAGAAFVEEAKAQLGTAGTPEQEQVLEGIGDGIDALFGDNDDADTIEANVSASGHVNTDGSFTLTLSVSAAAAAVATDSASEAAGSDGEAPAE